jgi:ParB family chromosome partitioning protein
MSEEARTTGLGRGLSSLLGDESEDYAVLDRARGAREVPIEQIRPNPRQPRQNFGAEELDSLTQSISSQGILQPILVRRVSGEGDAYEILAGERRWRAAQRARLHQVPVVIRDIDDGGVLEIALIENLQREDLTVLEEAEAYQRLIDEFAQTQEMVSETVGKSRSHVANTLRLLGLPEAIKLMLRDGRLSAGHGRALLGASKPLQLAEDIVALGLNVRQSESIAKGHSARRRPTRRREKDTNTLALEHDLSSALGLSVSIQDRSPRGGGVTISYETLEQLDELCRRLCHHVDH